MLIVLAGLVIEDSTTRSRGGGGNSEMNSVMQMNALIPVRRVGRE
jgi:hypothetical protein